MVPMIATARTSSAFDRCSSLAPIGSIGMIDPLRIPGSTIRSASTTIFGSVPTALTGVDHAPMRDGCSLLWQPLQRSSNSASPCFASLSSKPKIAFGHGGGRNLTTFSSKTLQGDEIRRRIAVPNGWRSRRGVGTDPLRLEVGERSEHLAGIARERLNEEAVGEAGIPLRAILPRRVPQERIADRRVGDLEIARDTEVAAGHAIDDHSKRIDPPRPPWRRRREADVHDVPELLDPSAEVDPELGRLGGRIAAAQDRLGKSIETIRLRQRGAGRSSQIGKKLLKVGICRRTVETQDMG